MASIRTLVPLIFSTQIVVAVGLTGWLSFNNGQRAVNSIAAQLLRQIASRIDNHLDHYLEMPQLLVETNVNQFDNGFLDVSNLMEPKNLEHLERYLWKKSTLFNSVSAILIANERGQFIELKRENNGSRTMELADLKQEGKIYTYTIDSQGKQVRLQQPPQPGYDPRQRPYYIAAVKAGRATWSKIYSYFTDVNQLAITAVQPLYNSQGKLLGVAGADLILDQVSQFLQNLKISQSGTAFIVEPSGLLVASSKGEPMAIRGGDGVVRRQLAVNSRDPLTRMTAHYLQQHFGSFHIHPDHQMEFIQQGQRNFLAVRTLEEFGLNWVIVVVIPEGDFMAEIEANTFYTILLCLGLMLTATVLGLLTARWLIRPILTLSEVATLIESEDYGKAASIKLLTKDTQRQDEFGQLARIFKKMIYEVQRRAEYLKAQLDHLQVEIDQNKKDQQVKEIIETDFFRDLKHKSAALRQRRKQ